MSWNKIKTFLIILFLIINSYLIFSDGGFETLFMNSYTVTDEDALVKTISVINNNYGIEVLPDAVPEKVNNLSNINVINLIYTDAFDRNNLSINHDYKNFTINADTNTYSYNESNAEAELRALLSDIGLTSDSYRMYFSKNDSGLRCYVCGIIGEYLIFNNRIEAVFSSQKIAVNGSWYVPESDTEFKNNGKIKMQSPTTFLMDSAHRMSTEESDSHRSINKVDFGYFVSYYDEQTVNKSATAIPCYVVEADNGSKYYYDALNGNFLKTEV